MKIVFLTAGAAGMFCGSCMHDNALAKALRNSGVDCLLQPLYTPIRTDEVSVATEQVFFGGVHIYLLQKVPGFSWVPGPIRRLLDRPGFLAWATRRAASTDAASLGDLAISMLRGEHGRQKEEVERLVQWLRDEMKPDVVIFSNLLIGGCIPAMRRELPQTKVVVILQGDDSFLDHLPAAHREAAIKELNRLGHLTDALIVNSKFYGDKMTSLIGLPPNKVQVLPLSIDTLPFADFEPMVAREPVTIGYLARVAPEKGFHHLVDAFVELAKRPGNENVRLQAAGWLGEQNFAYMQAQETRIKQAGLTDRFEYLGSPDLDGKLQMLRGIDMLCVPTEHEEPKGLFVLEAMAAGVPVVQTARGAFPELIETTGGGLLVPPGDPQALADALQRLVHDPQLRLSLGQAGRSAVLNQRTIAVHASSLLELISRLRSSA
jgi:glycosyltransferase involved in cell wall biosynthesis